MRALQSTLHVGQLLFCLHPCMPPHHLILDEATWWYDHTAIFSSFVSHRLVTESHESFCKKRILLEEHLVAAALLVTAPPTCHA